MDTSTAVPKWISWCNTGLLVLLVAQLIPLLYVGPKLRLRTESLLDQWVVKVIAECEPDERVIVVGNHAHAPALVQKIDVVLRDTKLHIWVRGRTLMPWDRRWHTTFRIPVPMKGLRGQALDGAILHTERRFREYEIPIGDTWQMFTVDKSCSIQP